MREADFGSIGTNDLVQYLYAVDRNNEHVAHDYQPDQPVIWSVIRSIADAAREYDRPLAICGELGGDPHYIPKVIETGISAVSTNPRSIPRVRAAARAALHGTN
jgi:phosphoenolpyruvate-protein kinase (PTS system EI component)